MSISACYILTIGEFFLILKAWAIGAFDFQSKRRSQSAPKEKLKRTKGKSGEEAGKRRALLCLNSLSKETNVPGPTCPRQHSGQQQQQEQGDLHPRGAHVTNPRDRHSAIVRPLPSVLSQHRTSWYDLTLNRRRRKTILCLTRTPSDALRCDAISCVLVATRLMAFLVVRYAAQQSEGGSWTNFKEGKKEEKKKTGGVSSAKRRKLSPSYRIKWSKCETAACLLCPL